MIDENSTKKEVLEAVRKNGYDLKYASETLKSDPDVILEALRYDFGTVKYVNKIFILEMVECWEYVHGRRKNNITIYFIYDQLSTKKEVIKDLKNS